MYVTHRVGLGSLDQWTSGPRPRAVAVINGISSQVSFRQRLWAWHENVAPVVCELHIHNSFTRHGMSQQGQSRPVSSPHGHPHVRRASWTTCEDAGTCTAKQLLHDDKARKLKHGSYNSLDECDVIPFQQDAPWQGVVSIRLSVPR